MSAAADFAAAHAMLLLAAATLLCAAAGAMVLGIAHLAVGHTDRLWQLADRLVPGHGLRARTYLLVHLALGFVLVLGVLTAGAIARGVSASGPILEFDQAFAAALQREIDPTWRSLFWWFTWLGSYLPLTLVVAAGMWRLLSQRRRLLGWMWGASQSGGLVVSETLKEVIARARPDGADPLLTSGTFSFPSGHAVASVVLCGVGAYILMKTIRSLPARIVLVAGAMAWCLAMGFSRLYLGVHYFSDVIGGFLIGMAWVAVCISGIEVIESQRSRVKGQK